jgi:hypothetical protein
MASLPRALVSVFVDEGGVSSPGFAIILPAGALSRGVGTFALGVTVSAAPGFDPGGAVAGFSSLAATTPLPVNSPGLEVAATAGRPWFSEARRLLSELAARSCWNCAGAAAACCSCAATSPKSAAVLFPQRSYPFLPMSPWWSPSVGRMVHENPSQDVNGPRGPQWSGRRRKAGSRLRLFGAQARLVPRLSRFVARVCMARPRTSRGSRDLAQAQ